MPEAKDKRMPCSTTTKVADRDHVHEESRLPMSRGPADRAAYQDRYVSMAASTRRSTTATRRSSAAARTSPSCSR